MDQNGNSNKTDNYMKRPTKLSKSNKDPWSRSDKINSALAILTFVALVITGISTCISKNGLELQQKQYVDFQKKDSLNAISDSIKDERYMELTHQQIEALESQVDALNRGVRNTEVSQRPLLGIDLIGFYLKETDESIEAKYQVKNFGIRPVTLNKVYIYTFDSKFDLVDKDTTSPNTQVTGTRFIQRNLKLPAIDGKTIDRTTLPKVNTFYICILFEYFDGEKLCSNFKHPIMYRWIKKERYQIMSFEDQKVYLFNLCTSKEQLYLQRKLNMINKLKIKEFME